MLGANVNGLLYTAKAGYPIFATAKAISSLPVQWLAVSPLKARFTALVNGSLMDLVKTWQKKCGSGAVGVRQFARAW